MLNPGGRGKSILPALIVHGGAWDIPEHLQQDSIEGCRKATRRGWEVLTLGGSAVDAVEAAVRVLEDDPTFDAGQGAVLNCAGAIELDAIIMDGSDLNLGAVIGVQRVRNPVTLARVVMTESEHAILAGEGAEAFAKRSGLDLVPNSGFAVEREKQRWQAKRAEGQPREDLSKGHPGDTVGAVALDLSGHLAVATSTGGTFYKHPGRVGDSPLVGCGAYADDWSGAVSATGRGESLMRVVISKSVCDLMYRGMTAQEAADAGIGLLARRTPGQGGLIVLGKRGDIGIAHNTPYLAHAYVKGDEIIGGVLKIPDGRHT